MIIVKHHLQKNHMNDSYTVVTMLKGVRACFINVATRVAWYHSKNLRFNQVYWVTHNVLQKPLI